MRDIDNAVVEFCEKMFNDAVKYNETPADAIATRGICYGAVQFVSNYGENGSPLGEWWNNTMLDKFNELAAKKRNEEKEIKKNWKKG